MKFIRNLTKTNYEKMNTDQRICKPTNREHHFQLLYPQFDSPFFTNHFLLQHRSHLALFFKKKLFNRFSYLIPFPNIIYTDNISSMHRVPLLPDESSLHKVTCYSLLTRLKCHCSKCWKKLSLRINNKLIFIKKDEECENMNTSTDWTRKENVFFLYKSEQAPLFWLFKWC